MNLLITGAFAYTHTQIESLKGLGLDVYFMQQESDALPIAAEKIDAAVCNGLLLHHSLSEFTNLRYIQLTSAGFDRVPLDDVNSRGIIIKNARGVYSIPMAEWTVCKVLDVYKGTAFALECQKTHRWEKNRNMREIAGKRVAVLGAGNVGSEVAKRFKTFGTEVTGYDITIFENNIFDQIRLISDFTSEANAYDIVVATLPLTPQTRGMIGHEVLYNLKQNAVFVNIARGAIVNTEDLIDVLTKRTDITAILDVFEPEPLPEDNPLWDMPNVIISPHNSFVSDGNNVRMFGLIMSNLKQYLVHYENFSSYIT